MSGTAQGGEQATLEEKRAKLARALRARIAERTVDFPAEAEIDLEFDRDEALASLRLVTSPNKILMTGGSGFVGAHLLVELMACTGATVFCLIRAADDEAAMGRIRKNLATYSLWDEAFVDRIVPLAGDLSQVRLGLSEDVYARLAGEVEVIYQIAAVVNLAYKYELLKPSNVVGLRNILCFAAAGRVKPVHYLSSYALFDSKHNIDKTMSEQDGLVHYDGLSNGYCESKWVAERMARNARTQGLQIAIYRVGWVVGHSKTGAWNKSDFIPQLIQACTEVGKACPLGTMTMTPVDYLVGSLTYLSLKESSMGDIFHLSNGIRYTSEQLFEWVNRCGYTLEMVEYEQWEEAVKGSKREVSLAPMLGFLEDSKGSLRLSDWFSREPAIDVAYSRSMLEVSGIPCPVLDEQQMKIYLDYFASIGYLGKL
jgi:thioester reductase-like protein